MTEAEIKADMRALMGMGEFRRFLWRVIQTAGIFQPTTNGSDGRHLVSEGRRQLGLEILADAERGFPVAHPDQVPILTMIQVLREETQQATSENKHDRYDRNAEIDDDPTDGD